MNIHAYHSGHKKQHEMFNKLNEPSGFDKIDCVGKQQSKIALKYKYVHYDRVAEELWYSNITFKYSLWRC